MKYEVQSTKYESGGADAPFVLGTSSFVLCGGRRRCSGFTLTELLVVILIIGIMTGLALAGLNGATELAREQRTRAIIAKLDQLVMERWESYRTRAVPIQTAVRRQGYVDPRLAARNRLNGLRELMRMEMPDRKRDIIDVSVVINPPLNPLNPRGQPALWNRYQRLAQRSAGGAWKTQWTEEHQGSECLYLIIASMHDGDKNALDFFSSDEIGDVDGDGMKEILDGWGNPINFIRWPAGFVTQPGADGQWGVASSDDDQNGTVDDLSEAGWSLSDDLVVQTTQTMRANVSPDPFDPVKADPHWVAASPAFLPYAIRPLIYSAGRDREYDIDAVVGNLSYASIGHDPYYQTIASGSLPGVGRPEPTMGFVDNITNHYQETP